MATIMTCFRHEVKTPLGGGAGRPHKGHGRDQRGLAFGRFAAAIILGPDPTMTLVVNSQKPTQEKGHL